MMSRQMKRGMLFAVIGLMASASPSAAKANEAGAPKTIKGSEEKPKPDVPNVIKLSLHPALPPAAALEYPLLPRFIDQHPGNAATLYIKVTTLLADRKQPQEYWEKISKWREMPLAEIPRGEVRDQLVGYDTILDMVKMAARREQCDWGPPVHETTDIFGILIPEMQHLRNVGNLLALKARWQMAEGRTADALETLQTGYALARQTADCPFLVCSLVGIALGNVMDQQVETLIQTSKCPNLYWSLTALPDPLVDLQPALALEADSLLLAFPELRDVEHAKHSPDEWDAMLVEFARRYIKYTDLVDKKWSDVGAAAYMTGRGTLLIPRAKDELVAAGRSRAEVDAMPAAQIILVDSVTIYKRMRDEMFKWFNVPYWEARKGFVAVDQKFKTELRDREIIPIASLLLPAVGKCRDASVRSQRRIDLLRVVEALRLYAAEHEGKLPAALDDVKEVPIPVDPVSGKPFGYKLEGGTATLDAPPPPGMRWDMLGARLEITIAAK
jgi:hypothetical protein